MDELRPEMKEEEMKIAIGEKKLQQDDVLVVQGAARASKAERRPTAAEGELPLKKRKTRRGKSKRKQPYSKNNSRKSSDKLVKPEAPHNSNQFLLEDHGSIEDLDRNLKKIEGGSPSTLTRTRDSSFSVDSEGEFYSSPDDEEQFLIKDFDDQYQSLQAERLQNMTKTELVHEYLQLESRLEQLSKKASAEGEESEDSSRPDLKQELERLAMENERLRRENELLRSQAASNNKSSDSEDSETDSSDSCSSSSSESNCDCNSCSSRSRSPIVTNNTDYSKTNGHLPGVETV